MCSEPRDEASRTLENLSLSSSWSTVAIIVLRDKPAQPSGPQRPALVRGSCTPGSAGPGWVRFCSLSVELLLGLAAGSPGCALLTGVPENEASRASALKAVACLPWADIPLAKTSHAGKSQVRGRRRRLQYKAQRNGLSRDTAQKGVGGWPGPTPAASLFTEHLSTAPQGSALTSALLTLRQGRSSHRPPRNPCSVLTVPASLQLWGELHSREWPDFWKFQLPHCEAHWEIKIQSSSFVY